MLRVYLNEIAHNTQKKNKSIKLCFYYNSLKNIEKNKLAKHIHTYIAKKIIYKDLQKNLNKLEQ